jgi:signal recognition particle receptor subunit beta
MAFTLAGRPTGPESIRAALELETNVPIVLCDARQRSSGKDVLIALVEHTIRLLRTDPARGTPVPAD